MTPHVRSYTRFLGAAALLTMTTFSLVAAAKLQKMGTSVTTFKANATAGLVVAGTTADMSIEDDGTIVKITVPLANISTGIALRDEHTKKALEVATYPAASLTVARSALKFAAAGAQSSGDAKGSLTLHGQTKDVTFHYVAKLNGSVYEVQANTTINVDDFGVKRPSYLGITVKPDVDISATFQAADR